MHSIKPASVPFSSIRTNNIYYYFSNLSLLYLLQDMDVSTREVDAAQRTVTESATP